MSAAHTAVTELKNFVNGEFVASTAKQRIDVIDPATGSVFATIPDSTEQDVAQAYAAAAAAFTVWKNTTPGERQRALLRIADAIEARAEELTDIECQDTGKPRARFLEDEVPVAADEIRFFAGAARNLEGRATAEYLADHTSSIRREPIGVIGQVTPWNYPFMMAVWKFAPAIAAGNTVVVKPSEVTPASTVWLAGVIAEFVPPGVVNVVLGGRDTGRALIASRVPAMVSITGSVRAGMQVAESAAHDLKRVHLELGGKAPVVVFDDANIDAAIEGIALAGFYNAGQDCTAGTRVLVQKGIHDTFVAALAAHAATVKTGAGDAEALYGPLSSQDQFDKVAGFLARLPSHATVNTGGGRVGDAGYFMQPTVISGLKQDDEAIQEEIFGPVITVQSFDTEAQAIEMANDVDYGLSASVWSANHGTCMRLSKELDFGVVWVNTHIPFVSEMPHGGFKHSGYGKDLSQYGFEDYTRIKHVMSYIGE
jgi:betaine-aldehyde dehydrogenase